MIKIYYLRNKNNEIFYVGKTKNSLPIRLSQHNHNLQKGGIDKASIYLLDEVEENNWEFWERYWIQQFKQWGFNLSNKK